jgi:hypothetical protein
MRTDNDWLEDGCLECGVTRFRESELDGVCVSCYDSSYDSGNDLGILHAASVRSDAYQLDGRVAEM